MKSPADASGEGDPRKTRDAESSRAVEHRQHDSFAALKQRDFALLASGKFVSVLGEQMVTFAVGWELYERTNSKFALGLVGLVQVLPIMVLALPAGHLADRFDRRKVILTSLLLLAAASAGLALVSKLSGPIPVVYLCLFLIGVGRSVRNPAITAIVPATVPPEDIGNAATWSSFSWQFASVLGPALGGIVIGVMHSATVVYVLDLIAVSIFCVLILLLRARPKPQKKEEFSVRSLGAGAKFVWNTKVLLAAITLDMFAVLLGGATALLPVFAKDILFVGPDKLGWMRSAPAIGAAVMAIVIASRPPFRRAGPALLWAVAGFGVATIVFGFSTNFWLSFSMLTLLGGLDQISVIIRSTLLLVTTPDALRGRVAAVHNVFLGASNELGEFESGVAAGLFGPVVAVVAGGIGTMVVVALIAACWPDVRRLTHLRAAET